MRKRLRRGAAFGVVTGVVAAFAVAGLGSVGAAVVPAGDAASAKQYEPKKITICHRTHSKKKPFVTIRVSQNALKAHQKHGDTVGPCANAVFTLCQKTKNGKQKTLKVKGAKKATKALKKGAKLGKCKTSGKQGKPKKGKPQTEKQKGKGKPKGNEKPKGSDKPKGKKK